MSDLRQRVASLTAEQRALLAKRLADRSAPAREPIAIVGMSCRMPGADGPEAFWRLLAEGRDAVGPPPSTRSYLRTEAGYLSALDGFDAAFFGITPREAHLMDPQQRLFLEVAWEALERAGIPADRLAGTATGVFVGIHSHSSDYHLLQLARPAEVDPYASTGAAHSIVANRLSYLLDLRGPSLAIDTACSSSLVAVHQACLSLRAGESDLAIAGGVNLILLEAVTAAFGKLGILSPRARCRVFDASADGIARGEGVGAVVLKRLTDAERDGDTVLALIRGSGVNQDGASNGLTAPNGAAQLDLLRKVWADSGIAAEELAFIETHGTGTSLGDPIEVNALATAIGAVRASKPIWLGAVKSNIGHLEAAAGIAALIKAVLCLQNRAVPGIQHFVALNPQIEFNGAPLAVPVRLEPLAADRRIAAVSSFGFGGTNAHLCLEAAPARSVPSPTWDGVLALPLSARDPRALDQLVAGWDARLEAVKHQSDLGDVIHTAGLGRAHHAYRTVAFGRDIAELRGELQSLRGPASGVGAGTAPAVAFVFTGQGSQWSGMGRDLFEAEPVFRAAAEQFARAYAVESGRDLLPVLLDGSADLADTILAQPMLVLVQIGLTGLLRSWGIVPDAVLGHSVGEVAAAHAAGVLDTESAARVVWHRARLMQDLPRSGRMIQVEASEAEILRWLDGRQRDVDVAALNAPESTVLSGAAAVVEAAAAALRGQGVRVQEVPVEYGFHSRLVESVQAPLTAVLAGLRTQAGSIPIVSSVTGRWAEPGSYGSGYWAANVRETVRFAPAVKLLREAGHTVFVEIGPHPALGGSILAAADGATVVATLRRNRPAAETLRTMIRQAYQAGLAPDWRAFGPGGRPDPTAPTYPWQREHFWIDEASPAALVRAVLGRSIDETRADQASDLTYAVEWRRSDHPLAGVPSPVAREPAAIRQGLARLDRLAGNGVAERERLEARAAWLIWRAVQELGLARLGSDLGFARLQQLGVTARFATLWERCCEHLAARGWAARIEETWQVVQLPAAEASPSDERAEGALLERCGSRLASVLRGQVDPLMLLFPQDGSAGASAIYTETPVAARCNDLAAGIVADVVRSWPADRPVRVVEIGAGTGATTSAVIGGLPPGSRYLATDLSTVFLRDLERRFGQGQCRFETRLFDVERDPASQQIPVGQADLVIATNVLHATRSLAETVAHTRALLAPGGCLVLIETTAPRAWQDLTFGLTAGWDRQVDGELRTGSGLLDGAGWIGLLERSGFGAGVAEIDSDPDGVQPYTVLLARADERVVSPLAGTGWLLLGRSAGLDALAAQMTAAGAVSLQVPLPADLSDDTSWSGAMTDARVQLGSTWGGVVLDCSTAEVFGSSDDELDRMATAIASVSCMLRNLGRSGDAAKLWIITRGGQAVEWTDEASPGQALLWGVGRSLALEHPALWGGMIDLDPRSTAGDADSIAQCLTAADEGDQFVWRGGTRWTPCLVPSVPPPVAALSLAGDATYLVTGATGRLAPKIVRWLAGAGGRRVVLVGRTSLPDRAEWPGLVADTAGFRLTQLLTEADQLGLAVEYTVADVSNDAAMAEIFERAASSGHPVRGVVHAASSHRAEPLVGTGWAAARESLTGKVGGGLVLHRLAEQHAVDFLIMFSSTAGILGGRDMATYAGANQVLDALAVDGRRRGLPWLSIAWGTFDDVSSLGAVRAGDVESLGFRPIDDRRAFALLGSYLSLTQPVAVIADIDRSRLRAAYQASGRRAMLDELEASAAPVASEVSQPVRWADGLAGLDAEQARSWLIDQVRAVVADVLGLPAERVDPDRGLFDVGLDSLMAVQLRSRLATVTGTPMPTTLVFNYPSVVAVADFIAELLRGDETRLEPVLGTRESTPSPEPIHEMDDAAIRELLRAELGGLGSPPDDGARHGG